MNFRCNPTFLMSYSADKWEYIHTYIIVTLYTITCVHVCVSLVVLELILLWVHSGTLCRLFRHARQFASPPGRAAAKTATTTIGPYDNLRARFTNERAKCTRARTDAVRVNVTFNLAGSAGLSWRRKSRRPDAGRHSLLARRGVDLSSSPPSIYTLSVCVCEKLQLLLLPLVVVSSSLLCLYIAERAWIWEYLYNSGLIIGPV